MATYEPYAIGDRDDLITEDRRFDLSSLREWSDFSLRMALARSEITVVMKKNGLAVLRRFDELAATDDKFIDFQFLTQNNNLVTLRFQVWDLDLIGFRVGNVGNVWYERKSENNKHSIFGSTFLPFKENIISRNQLDEIYVGRLALNDALETLAAYPNKPGAALAYKTACINISEALKFLAVCITVYKANDTRGDVLEAADCDYINNWVDASTLLLDNKTDEFIKDRLGILHASHFVSVLKRCDRQ